VSETALVVDGISKYFGEFAAVENVSFVVPKGCIYGLLGPNGAGKTTTLRMINDILVPDKGSVTLLGDYAPGPEAARRIGYLPEERGLYPKMRVSELLAFFGELRGLPRGRARERSAHWLARLGIADWAAKRVQDLSKGMQQKVQFATALIHEPELFILDEPWSGLDPINAEVLRDIVLEQRDAGKTVVFSTHRMEQAEQICDYVCIMARGKKALDGALNDIKQAAIRDCEYRVELATESECEQAAGLLPEGATVKRNGRSLEVVLAGGSPTDMLARFVTAKLGVTQLHRVEPTLHEIFVDRVGQGASTAVEGREAQ